MTLKAFKVVEKVYAGNLEKVLSDLWDEGYRQIQILEGGSGESLSREVIKFYVIVARNPVITPKNPRPSSPPADYR